MPKGIARAVLVMTPSTLPIMLAFVTDVFEFVRENIQDYMRQGLLSGLLALLLAVDVYGQVKSVSVPVYKSGDTTLSYKTQCKRIAQMKMRDPLISKDSFLLRVSTENWAVEVISADLRTFEGRQYFFTKQVVPSGGRGSEELLYKSKSMNKSQTLAVYEAFRKKSISSIPSESDIVGWPLGFDGTIYLIEYASPSTYSFKSYWEPSSSRYRLVEAAAVDDFVKEVEAKLELASSFLAFLNKLPAGTYHTGGITTHTNTEKERKARK